MFKQDVATENCAVALAGAPHVVPYRIVELHVLPDFQLYQRFADGVEGRTEMRDMIFSENAGIFKALRNPETFSDVSIDPDFGSVQWACGLDIAPDASHDDIQQYGVQILR